jgi:hypothetical protein
MCRTLGKTSGGDIAAEPVGDNGPRDILESPQQLPKELLGCPSVAARLHQDIEYLAVLIHGSPPIPLLVRMPDSGGLNGAGQATFGQKRLIEMPNPNSSSRLNSHIQRRLHFPLRQVVVAVELKIPSFAARASAK